MNELPCLSRAVLWLAAQQGRVTAAEMRRKLMLQEVDSDALLVFCERRGLIKDIAQFDNQIQSFAVHPTANELAKRIQHCPGFGETPIARDQVFVVHGRDTAAVRSLVEFLKALGLGPITFQQAIQWARKATPHIDEILDAGLSRAFAAIVLFTGEDEAKLRPRYRLREDPASEDRLQPQPRPNVLFEAGMVMARFPKRTVLVQWGDRLRPFSDIAGLHILRLRDTYDSRKTLREKLELAGCKIRPKGDGWLTAGDFPPPPKSKPTGKDREKPED